MPSSQSEPFGHQLLFVLNCCSCSKKTAPIAASGMSVLLPQEAERIRNRSISNAAGVELSVELAGEEPPCLRRELLPRFASERLRASATKKQSGFRVKEDDAAQESLGLGQELNFNFAITPSVPSLPMNRSSTSISRHEVITGRVLANFRHAIRWQLCLDRSARSKRNF